ncbi:hypothetical protein Acsp02_27200 [Actinoplanes sp. NBRC 103695]|nr:hypothetical protein Acsp02_27200 [Actinoplanes sp. NBRC 103695]
MTQLVNAPLATDRGPSPNADHEAAPEGCPKDADRWMPTAGRRARREPDAPRPRQIASPTHPPSAPDKSRFEEAGDIESRLVNDLSASPTTRRDPPVTDIGSPAATSRCGAPTASCGG